MPECVLKLISCMCTIWSVLLPEMNENPPLWLLWVASHAMWSHEHPCGNPAVYQHNLHWFAQYFHDHLHTWMTSSISSRTRPLTRVCLRSPYAKPEKCGFCTKSTEYLSYQIFLTGLTMSLNKVWTILDWPKPWKVKDIQSFLGFADFYHCFIFNYSNIVISLAHFTSKGVLWTFTDSCCTTF